MSSQSVHTHPSTGTSAALGPTEGVHEGEEDAVGLSGHAYWERGQTVGVDCVACREEWRVLLGRLLHGTALG